jgi:hypothetical protein
LARIETANNDRTLETEMPTFLIYILGFMILAAGVLVGASYLGVSSNWLLVIGLILGGIAIISGVVSTQRKENPDA